MTNTTINNGGTVLIRDLANEEDVYFEDIKQLIAGGRNAPYFKTIMQNWDNELKQFPNNEVIFFLKEKETEWEIGAAPTSDPDECFIVVAKRDKEKRTVINYFFDTYEDLDDLKNKLVNYLFYTIQDN